MLLIPPLILPRRLPTPEHSRMRLRLLELLSRNRQVPRCQLLLNQLPSSNRLVLIDRRHTAIVNRHVRIVLPGPSHFARIGEFCGLFFGLEGGVEVGEGVGG